MNTSGTPHADGLPERLARVSGGRPRALVRVGVALSVLVGMAGCTSAHVVVSLDDDAGTVQPDAGPVEPDAGPVIDPCPVVYVLTEVTVPPLVDNLGFNLDGGDSEAGCREDGPGGTDNGVQDLDAFILRLFPGFSLNGFITVASSNDFLEIPAISIDRCSAQPTIQAVSAVDGTAIGAPMPLDIAADGSFFARVGVLPVATPIVLLPQAIDISLQDVHIRGRLDADDQMTDLVVGGTLDGARLAEFADSVSDATGLSPGLVRGVLRTYLDMDTDPELSGCEGLSFQIVATATIDNGQGPGPNPEVRFRSNEARTVAVGRELRVDIVDADDHRGLSIRTTETVATGSVERNLPTLNNGPDYEYALVLGVAVGTTTVELLDGDEVRDTFELTVVAAPPFETPTPR